MALRDPGLLKIWRRQAERLLADAQVLYFVSNHPRTRWYIKCVAGCPVAYLFSPVQLIPSFIPVIGFLDDLLVLRAAAKLVRRFTPPDLLQECRELAEASEISRKEDFGRGRLGSARSLTAWLLVAGVASALVLAYVLHSC